MSSKVDNYRDLPTFESKTIPTFIKATDEKEGIVEHIVSVFGVRDMQNDRVMPGAFVKTILERAGNIRTLDQHLTDSALRVVGKPKALREIGRGELPQEVLAKFPEATGGLLAITQYAMKTDNGRQMFHLVDGGFLPETSIGYDPIISEYIDEEINGKTVTTRLLKEVRLWEYSNVIWGANQATATTGTKAKQDAPEAEPEPEPERYVGGEEDADTTPDTETKVGRVFSARNASRIRGHIDSLQQALQDLEEMLESAMPASGEPDEEPDDEQAKAAPAPEEQAATGHEPEAGPPDQAPTQAQLAEIDELLEQIEGELSEVDNGG